MNKCNQCNYQYNLKKTLKCLIKSRYSTLSPIKLEQTYFKHHGVTFQCNKCSYHPDLLMERLQYLKNGNFKNYEEVKF